MSQPCWRGRGGPPFDGTMCGMSNRADVAETGARYDGLAAWYDTVARPSAEFSRNDLVDLLGPGSGLCLDLGCGTGLNAEALEAAGRMVVGVGTSRVTSFASRARRWWPPTCGPLHDASFDTSRASGSASSTTSRGARRGEAGVAHRRPAAPVRRAAGFQLSCEVTRDGAIVHPNYRDPLVGAETPGSGRPSASGTGRSPSCSTTSEPAAPAASANATIRAAVARC
jgi:hypothetical protein